MLSQSRCFPIDSPLPGTVRPLPSAASIEPLETRIAPALVLAVSDGNLSTTPGSTLTYTIDFANNGEEAAPGVVLTDTQPAGTTFDAAENPGWSEDAGVLSLAAGDLAAGANGSATLILHVAEVAPAGLEEIVHTVDVARAGAVEPEATASDTTALVAAPDLTVTKTPDAEGSVLPGATIHYSIVYGNVGDQDATGVVLTEHLPSGTSFDSLNSSAGWTEVEAGSGLYELVVGSVGGGTNGTKTFAVKVNDTAAAAQGQISNTIDIADDGTNGTDPTPATNTAINTITLNAAPDLTLTKTNDLDQVRRGQTLNYALGYANAGNQNATGVVITETLPTGVSFDAAENPEWTLDGTTLTFTVGNLAAGATGTALLVLHVDGDAPLSLTQISNTASIADDGANGADLTPGNNTATDTDPLLAPLDLTLTKTDGVATATAGQTLAYTFHYGNDGGIDAHGVLLTDALPAGTTFDPVANPGWVLENGTLTFAVGDVNAGTNATATLVLKVATTLPGGLTHITNTASIADDGTGGFDAVLGNNSATDSDTITAGAVDLTLQKTSGSNSLTPGGTVTYTFTFGNVGDADASGLIITDALPTGTTFNEAANPGWVLNGTTLTYAISSLTAGGTGTASLTLGIASIAPAGLEQILNAASIADDGAHGADLHAADNSASLSLPLNAAPNLTITQSNGGAAITPGGTITYTFNYTNAGTQNASGVVLTDTLPAGTTFDAATNPDWTLNGSTLTRTLGAVNAGTNGTATLILKAATSIPSGQSNIVNVVSIADDGASGADSAPADNTATATNAFTSAVDLTLTLGSPSTTTPGSTIPFTLSYSNAGTQATTGVVLTQNLPSGTTFNAASSTPGWTEVSPGVYKFTVGALAGGASGSAVFAVDVTNPAAASLEQLFDTASITSEATETSTSNNNAEKTVTLTAAPNLGVTVTSSKTKISPGGIVTYTITYANTGTQNASGVKLTETLPAGLSFLATGSSEGWTNAGTNIYQFSVGALAGGQSGSVTFVAKAANGLSAASVTDRVEITDDSSSGADSDLSNNEKTLVLPVKKSGLPNTIPSPVSGGKGFWALADGGEVKVFSKTNGVLIYKFRPYGDDVEHVKVAMADLNGDGVAEIITTAKNSSKVRIYDVRTGALLNYFKPFGDVSTGVRVFVWDVNGDGIADILAKQRDGDGTVRVFNGATVMTTLNPTPFTVLQT